MSFDFGELILVPFPFTDQTTTKRRPAVVVSSREYQLRRPDVVLMAITSQVKPSPFYGDRPIHHWKEAGLLKPGVIKPVVATVHKKLVLKRLGKLQPDDIEALRALFAEILRPTILILRRVSVLGLRPSGADAIDERRSSFTLRAEPSNRTSAERHDDCTDANRCCNRRALRPAPRSILSIRNGRPRPASPYQTCRSRDAGIRAARGS